MKKFAHNRRLLGKFKRMATFLKPLSALAALLVSPLSAPLATPLIAQPVPQIPMAQIPAGSFTMGAEDVTLPPEVISGFGVMSTRPVHGDFDELPEHRVTISHAFSIATHLVTAREFQQFDPTYKPVAAHPEYAAGISYQQAIAFCTWLTKRTGKPYHLPTEAEWEYAERAGTQTPFFTGDTPPAPGRANTWGVVMGEGTPEWVADWYGPYPSTAQTDPTGPQHGYFRVVRGGGLDFRKSKPGENYPATAPYFMRSANRASMAPSYASNQGNIGFRVVQAPMPAPNPSPAAQYFFFTDVKQTPIEVAVGPDPSKPFYHVHELFPSLNGKSMPDVGWRMGLAPGLGINYHNSAVQVLANGDVVAAYYNTPRNEDDPDQTVMVMRRRAGAEDWDMPEPWPDFADAACAAPVFWNDRGHLWLFFGFPRLIGAPPFAFTTSDDNGASWSPIQFPHFTAPIGRYVSQPINSVVRAKNGTIYIPTDSTGRDADGNGSISAVWATRDNGRTWYDTGGRTAGRHTTIVIARNGDILGFGGKNSAIDGRMPLATSADGGRTWVKSKTPFDPLDSGERPSVIRLASGRFFFVADYNPNSEKHTHKDGAYVALSDDDGKTWKLKRLPSGILTVGYVTATQGPDGTIHIVTSKNIVNYEIELNEAWILSDTEATSTEPESTGPVTKHTEKWPNGKAKAEWGTARASDGRVLLEGPQTFCFENGAPQWTASFHLGKKLGEEVFYRTDSTKEWSKSYSPDGTWTWRVFDDFGKQTAESHWRGKTLVEAEFAEAK
jgi:formylglycine-generating enzyme required for sulfatase activity